jgi:pSer/pThr/pTyr-binding forkhead associated (FHA) protein
VLFVDLKAQVLDLGSTNGTFLNGKQVHRALLKDGDQIQIGGSIFRVAMGKEGAEPEPPSEASVKQLQTLIQKSKGQSSTHSGQSSAISGNLSEIRLPSLLQVLESDRATDSSSTRRTGSRIHRGSGDVGRPVKAHR